MRAWPCETKIVKKEVVFNTKNGFGQVRKKIIGTEITLIPHDQHTLTSGQEGAVKSQSGHLNVLGSMCALLWFSMSERPWKASMHMRQEKRLVLNC